MTDNVTVSSNTGSIVIAADEVTDVTLGSVKVQYVKLMDGSINGTNKATIGPNGIKIEGSIADGANTVSTAGLMVGGSDGNNYHNFATDTSGRLTVVIANSNTAPANVQQIVSGLPVGAANPLPVSAAFSVASSPVANTNPLPVQTFYTASGLTPVQNTFTTNTASPWFTPIAGRPFNVTATFNGTGSVQLERSFDSGTTATIITGAGTQLYVWNSSASEILQESEVGVKYRLNCTVLSSGNVAYRISQ